MRKGCLRRNEYRLDVDRHHSVEVGKIKIFHCAPKQDAGIVHKDIQSAETRQGVGDRALYRLGDCTVGLYRECAPPGCSHFGDQVERLVLRRRVGKGHSLGGEATSDRGTYSTRSPGDEGDAVEKSLSHQTSFAARWK
jgi:hypothetical protein